MANVSSADDYLTDLLSGSTSFSEIATEFGDVRNCFKDLQETAKTSLESFDDYLSFYELCLETDSTGTVERFLEKNAGRMLKNMVLRDSRAGRRFHITTATELHRRIEAFQSIGVEQVSPRAVVFTIFEHLIDDEEGPERVYERIDSLFTETPDTPTETIEVLAQIRLVAAMQMLNSDLTVLRPHINRFFKTMPDRSRDDRSTSEVLESAEDAKYSDPEKVLLYRIGLARTEEPDLDLLTEYLYLSGRDVAERYRHKSRNDPWRGELQLASWQLQSLFALFEGRMSSEQVSRSKSYQHLISGELRSGGRWRSQREHIKRPDPNFMKAAEDFVRAAEHIKQVDANRYIKYISRGFRFQAAAVRQVDRGWGPAGGWETSRQLHKVATEVLIQMGSKFENDEEIQETVLESLSFHKFRGNQAAAVAAFEHGDPDQMWDHINEAREHIERIPMDVNEELLSTLEELVEALRLDEAGEFEEALRYYRDLSSSKLRLKKRKALVEIKRDLMSGSEKDAIERSEEVFEPGSPVLTAVQIATGSSVSSPSIKPPVLEDLSGVDRNIIWRFATFSHLVSRIEETDVGISTEMRNAILDL